MITIAGKADRESGSALAREVLHIFGGGTVLRLSECIFASASWTASLQQARAATAVVLATFLPPDASPEALQTQRTVIRRVTEANRPAVMIAFGAEPAPGELLLPARMLAWQTPGPAAELAAARALAGLVPISGRLSVDIPGWRAARA